MSEQTIKIKPLSNGNYQEWSGEMRALLMRGGLWSVVSGKGTKPSATDELAKWETKVEKAAGEIYLAVESDQRIHFNGKEDDPKAMWDALQKAHLHQKPGARFNAYDELFSIHKADDETLLDMATKVGKAMSNIKNLRPSDFTLDKLDDELLCMAMIRALPESYANLASNLLLQKELTKDVILQAFRAEELNRQRQANVGERANRAGFSGHRGGRGGRGGSRGGYYNSQGFRTKLKCFLCGEEGHLVAKCPKNQVAAAPANANKAEEGKEAEIAEKAGNASTIQHAFGTSADHRFDWNTDSGATAHMTPHRHWFKTYTKMRKPVRLADHNIVYTEGVGSVVFRPVIDGKQTRVVEFARVLHVPDLQNNLFSVLYLTQQKGFDVHISKSVMTFEKDGYKPFIAKIGDDNVGYLMGETIVDEEYVHSATASSTLPLDLTLWHRRLAHHNYESVKNMVNDSMVEGLTMTSKNKPDPICEPCLAGKMHANPFPTSKNRATKVLELIHTDVHYVGTATHSGYQYWVTFIDDYSRFRVVYPMKTKDMVFDSFKRFKAYAENHLGHKIDTLRDDKGGEYMSNEFLRFTDECGISRQHTVRNRPQQNGVAERANRTLDERITAMLNESGLSKAFWGECLAALVHIWNRCPTSAVEKKTPFELWHGKKPDVSHLRIWGCTAYVHVQKDKRNALGSHMEKCIFIGYPAGYKGWKFYNPTTKKTVISERAEFDERYMLGSSSVRRPQDTNNDANGQQYYVPLPATPIEADDDDSIQVPLHEPDRPEENHDQGEAEDVQPEVDERPITPPPRPPPELPDEPLALRRQRRNPKPTWKVKAMDPQMFDDDDDEGEDAEYVHASSLEHYEPNTYAEAMAGPDAQKWHEASLEELNAHLRNGTWSLEKLPPGKKAIGSRWVFRVKRNADGIVERYKARIVAKGYNQRPGFDYMEIFAPTMRQATIRLILALAAIDDLHLRSVDISHAFINGDIDAEVYMTQPEGFKELGPEYVCKLNKSIYGLKQAARLWNEKLHSALLDMGFNRIRSDPALYIYRKDEVQIIMPVYVDDITLASNSQTALDKTVSELSKHFKLRDLGETSYLLGVAIRRDRANRKIYLSQKQYIMDVLKRFGMEKCHTVDTPMNPGLNLSKDQSPKTDVEKEEMKDIPYISAVGSVMYLAMMTRVDIAETASVLARFNSNPGMAHWKAAKHLLRYLAGTMEMELCLGPDPESNELIRAYADADHGGNRDNGKSTTGYLIKVGSGAVSWSSKLQPIVALSTTEAEYVAACAAGKEIIWMQKFLGELGYGFPRPTKLFMDNQSAISVAKNPEHHGRMKHLDLCFYWLRDKVEQGYIEPVYLQTDQMPADLLTKALPRVKVMFLRKLMGLEI